MYYQIKTVNYNSLSCLQYMLNKIMYKQSYIYTRNIKYQKSKSKVLTGNYMQNKTKQWIKIWMVNYLQKTTTNTNK